MGFLQMHQTHLHLHHRTLPYTQNQRNTISPVWPLFSAGKQVQCWCVEVTEQNHQYCHHLPPTPPKISINHGLFLSPNLCKEQMSRGLRPETGRGWPAAFRGSDGLWRPQTGPQASILQTKEKTYKWKPGIASELYRHCRIQHKNP